MKLRPNVLLKSVVKLNSQFVVPDLPTSEREVIEEDAIPSTILTVPRSVCENAT